MNDILKRIPGFEPPAGPVVLAIMDGVGIGQYEEGDAVRSALTPHLDWLGAHTPTTRLKAHGTAVGLPSDDDMGNSEVGHNAIGAGRVFDQGAKLVNESIASGAIFRGQAWQELLANVRGDGGTLHIIALLSDGNVHSHVDQLRALFAQARKEGVRRARMHALLDGRDVNPTSALVFVDAFEAFLRELSTDGADYRIASGGGRMVITMDRYNADWSMVERGWQTHVHGKGRTFASARAAIETFRAERPGVIDQDLPAFVVAADGAPVGPIRDGDSVILANFRGDRAIEISRAFDDEELLHFDRSPRPKVVFAGMMQYDGDLRLPRRYLVTPPAISRTMGEYLVRAGIPLLATSETQKFGHMTYFFNGNRSGKFDEKLEEYVEIPSDRVPFEERPWMKAAEITDCVLAAIASGKHRFIRANYPNGDMVGHTGVFQAVQISVEATDLSLGRVMAAVRAAGGVLVVSADHGNADDMYEHDRKTGAVKIDPATGLRVVKTCHSLNPVPCHIYWPGAQDRVRLAERQGLGIASLAATCMRLLGYEAPEDYAPSIVEVS